MKKTKILLVGSLLLGTIIISQGLSETKKVSAAEGDTYELVTDASTLSVGDTLVIASNTKGVTLGALSDKIFTAVSSTFSTDKSKITDLKTGLEFTLGGEKDKWDFTYNNKKVGAIAAKSIAFDKGTTTWKISINESNDATIQNTTSTNGKFLYNVKSPRFTTYASDPNAGMLLPQLYRKVVDLSVKHDVNYVTNCDTKLEPKQFAEGVEITLPTEELAKNGYIFDGWYTDAEFKYKFVEGTKMGTQDVTLYANWILDTSTKYTVTFMLNDGTESAYTSVIAKENETIKAPTTPTREGFKFTTWYTNIDLTEEFNFSTKITSDLTLYAGWEVYTIPTYTKVTSNLDDWTGKYLIVYEKGKVCFDGSLSLNNIDSANNIKNISIENNKIIGDYKNYQFTFEKKDNGYSIKSSSNIYIGNTTKGNNLKYSVDNLYTNTISFKNNVLINGEDGTILKYNNAKDQQRFRFYKSSSSQQIISLYKLEEKQEEKPTIDSTIITTDYLCTSLLMNDSISKAIRFIGSINETKFADLQRVGFNFTLNNTTTKEYNTELSKLYHIIDDSDKAFDTKSDEIYVKNGYLNYSLILNNIPDNFTGTITYYAFATINDVNYQTEAKTINLVNGNESK